MKNQHEPRTNPVNALDRVWAGLSSTDRFVLLGHDRDLLTDVEKLRLAKTAAALRRTTRARKTRPAPDVRQPA